MSRLSGRGATRVALVSLLIAAGGCDLFRDDPVDPNAPDAHVVPGVDGAPPVDAAPATPGMYPPPRTDRVDHVGGVNTFEIATWNVRNLGTTELGQQLTDVSMVADVIASLDVDLIAIEEVASETAWNELVARLPDRAGVLSTHVYKPGEYQKIGFLYRKSSLRVVAVDLPADLKDFSLARTPLQVSWVFDDGVHATLAFDTLGVHLEAGQAQSDMDKRVASIRLIDSHLQRRAAVEDQTILLGDFNQAFKDADSASLTPFLYTSRYAFRTRAAAEAGEISHASRRFIDQIVTTVGFAKELGAAAGHVVRVDQDPDVPNYDDDISDHYPVVMTFPLAPR